MRTFFAVISALPLLSASAFGWGCEGHETVALIARAHLTPQVSAEIDRLLRENPIDPALNRYCKDRPNDLMADASTWADDVRNIEKTGDWHFIDIPRAAESGDLMQWCKDDCVVSVIESQRAILRDARQPAAARARALRYIIHFVGDLAQPLHAIDNRDRGGNCTEFLFFAEEKPANLHAIWDSKIIQRDLEARKESITQYAEGISSETRTYSVAVDPAGWAWASHALAIETTYGALNPPVPVASSNLGPADDAACTAERTSVAALHIAIDDAYVDRALPVIRKQIALAGYRLAALLNQAVTSSAAPSLP